MITRCTLRPRLRTSERSPALVGFAGTILTSLASSTGFAAAGVASVRALALASARFFAAAEESEVFFVVDAAAGGGTEGAAGFGAGAASSFATIIGGAEAVVTAADGLARSVVTGVTDGVTVIGGLASVPRTSMMRRS